MVRARGHGRPPLPQLPAIHGKKFDVDPLRKIEPGTEKKYQPALDTWAQAMEHLQLPPTHGLLPGYQLPDVQIFLSFLQYYVATARGRLAGDAVTLHTAKGVWRIFRQAWTRKTGQKIPLDIMHAGVNVSFTKRDLPFLEANVLSSFKIVWSFAPINDEKICSPRSI